MAASVIWAAYRDFPFSSNLLTKAAMIRRPVLVSRGGLLADRARAHGLGQAVDCSDAAKVVVALESLANRVPLEGAPSTAYFAGHSRDRLPSVLGAMVPAVSESAASDAGINGLAVH